MITHVVAFTFTTTSDRDEAKTRLEALPAQIEELRSLTVGLDVVQSPVSADLVLISTHDDLAGLRAYQTHRVHEEFATWLAPLLSAKTAVDFES